MDESRSLRLCFRIFLHTRRLAAGADGHPRAASRAVPRFLSVLVAILGTTISLYLFFWQAAEEVEEKNEKAAEKGKTDGPLQHATAKELRSARTDTITGMLFSNLIMYFIILTT